ncbi:hypothetical protein V2G26_009455 [Clonostachys chloroleuca]
MSSSLVDSVLSTLSLKEKISLLAGGEVWSTVPLPGKGIPSIKTTDGPNGARGSKIKDGVSAACFPAACSVASTFDVDIARRIGEALGEECLTKGAKCLLAPTVCIHRHPLGGRNFESFSEDPFLSGQMGSYTVVGLQSRGVAATVKHFVANEQETRRLDVNAIVAERPLREVYLKPFELIVKNANPWAVMTAYNKINGEHADSNAYLIQKILRAEWGWKGLVMSDWGGTNSTAEALNAGTDLEMPGPTRWRQPGDVIAAIESGKVTVETIDARACQVLEFVNRLKGFGHHEQHEPEEEAINNPNHAALIREAGSKGIVLLKNHNSCLPLTKEKLRGRKIALLGYAKECLAHGGGSASVMPHYRVTPYDAFCEHFKDCGVDISYSKGAHTFRQLPLLVNNIRDATGEPGFTYHVYQSGQSTSPIKTVHGYDKSEMSLLDGHVLENVEVELLGRFRPPETATYYFTLSSLGPCQVYVNDEVLLTQKNNCRDAMGFLFGGVPVPRTKLFMDASREYEIRVRATPPLPSDGQGLGFLQGQIGMRLGCMSSVEHDADVLSDATELAKAADYSIILTGHDPSWETEGQDRLSFSLPKEGSQDQLVEAVAAVCPNVTVVNCTGSAVALPWLDDIQALLQAWLPGQEAGHSIVDVLTGVQNPEGHLTCTFPKRLEDCPAFENFPGQTDLEGGPEVRYEEGVFVGYRHFDRLPLDTVHFPFGFGLSYTSFSFGDLEVDELRNGNYRVKIPVSNVGDVKGATAVQVYIGQSTIVPANPVKALAAFSKVSLESGQVTVVEMEVQAREFAFWDERMHAWVIEGGEYDIGVYRSAADLVAKKSVAINPRVFAP